MTLPPNPQQPDPTGDTTPEQPQASQDPAVPQQPAAPEQPITQTPPQYAPPVAPPAPPQAPLAAPAPQYGAPQPPSYGAPQAGQPVYGAPQYQQQYAAPQFPPALGIAPGPGGPFDGAGNADDMSRPLYGATFGQAIKRFFKGYVKFNGRASRSEYWWVGLFSFLVQLVPMIVLFSGIFAMVASTASYSYDSYSSDPYSSYSSAPAAGAIALLIIGGVLTFVVSLGLLIPSLAIGWRRMHDANFAGPLYLISLASAIPYIGWIGSIVVLVFTIMPSKAEGRRFDYA